MSLLQIEEKDGEREGEERETARVSEQDRVAGRDGSSAVRQEQASLRLSLSEQQRDTHSQGDFVAHQPLSLPAMAILYRLTHTHTPIATTERGSERAERERAERAASPDPAPSTAC